MLTPNQCQTFDDCFQQVFISYLKQQFLHVSRIDVVWDRYLVGSINGSTIDKRGSGIRRKFDSTTKLPLFKFLANKIILHNSLIKCSSQPTTNLLSQTTSISLCPNAITRRQIHEWILIDAVHNSS